MGGHELQDILELIRSVGVHLRGRAHLGEAEPSESEQRIVSIDALLEQGVNVPRHHLSRGGSPGAVLAETSFGTIHDPHFSAPQGGLLFDSDYPRISGQEQAGRY
jgi:hypothetical protein